MTTTEAAPCSAPIRAGKPECVACGRPYGRRRSPRTDADSAQIALLDCDELIVCDQCWHLAGNTSAVTARLINAPTEPALVFDRTVEALLLAANDYDLLHPLDRFLVESGVRWAVLRHIAVPARMQLAAWIAQRCPPEATRPADSPDVWLDEVETRIRAQTRPGQTRASAAAPGSPTGSEFVYNAKRRRWWRICHILRSCADRDTRPLTWVTQDEIAAAIGCSTRTVRRCVAWLRDEGLLWEIVPGCRLPQACSPDGDTIAEAAQREHRMAAAIAAEEAAMTRARAELAAVGDVQLGAGAVTTAQYVIHPGPVTPHSTHDIDTLDLESEIEPEPTLVNLAPVYELRVPLPAPDETIQQPTTAPYNKLTSTNTAAANQDHENVHPPQVSNQDHSSSNSVQPVDKRRAPRSIDQRSWSGLEDQCSSTGTDARTSPARQTGQTESAQYGGTQQSEAVRAAQWLLRSRLDPRTCDRVSVRWLAAQIRGAHFLDRHGWTWDDLADQLHGYPQHTHLPHHIRDCRAWIRARISHATPTLSPTKLRIVLDIERGSDLLRRRRRDAFEAERQAEIASRRAAIADCGLCDEVGWIHVDSSTPTARCNHDPDSGGW